MVKPRKKAGTRGAPAGQKPKMAVVPGSGRSPKRETAKPERPLGPVTIFHNPRCSTSKKVLARLLEAGLDPIVVEYLENPPTALQLADIARKAGIHPREMIRTKEPEFAALGRTLEDLGAAGAIAAMRQH